MRMGRCCFVSCCCCSVLILLLLVVVLVGGFFVVRQGMVPPPNYARSTVPVDPARGRELLGKIQSGHKSGSPDLALSQEDLRGIVAAQLEQDLGGKFLWWPLEVGDVQVGFGSPAQLPSFALPRAYPVPLDKSVQLDVVAALNFGPKGGEPFVVYPLFKTLAGVEDCKLYFALIDVGVGPYAAVDTLAKAQAYGPSLQWYLRWYQAVKTVPLPAGTCATELTRTDTGLRLAFGPESGGEASSERPAEMPAEQETETQDEQP